MKFSKIEVIGFISTWLILIGYFFIKTGRIDPQGFLYQGINLIGSVGIVWVSLRMRARQPAILNVVWATVALIAIGRLFFL